MRRHIILPLLVILTAAFPLDQTRASSASFLELSQFWSSIGLSAPMRGAHRYELLAKAQPDECFVSVGSEDNLYDPSGAIFPCERGIPKTNEAYVWGLTKDGPNIWYGSGPNIHCLVMKWYMDASDPVQTDSYVCEVDENPPFGDARPPSVYRYHLPTESLTRIRPENLWQYGGDMADAQRLATTAGIRSAGTYEGVVIVGGPSMNGINLFAFDSVTSEFLGSTSFEQYTNIRKWLVVKGVLYTAVRHSGGGGAVLRWRGSAADPFQFEVVADLDSEGAELAQYGEDRIAISTWPSISLEGGVGGLAGIFVSPAIPEGGLTGAHTNLWIKGWEFSDYDPDPVTAATYGGGAVEFYDGWLYWGSMHVPLLSTYAHIAYYGAPSDELGLLTAALGTLRAISIFRGKDLHTENPTIELLYGEEKLPVFDPISGWQILPTKMGRPRYGRSGLGNIFNNYTWTMAVHQPSKYEKEKLFLGTMDWSYLVDEMLEDLDLAVASGFGSTAELPGGFEVPTLPGVTDGLNGTGAGIGGLLSGLKLSDILAPTNKNGADLFYFPSTRFGAIPANLAGQGNDTSYGIRTMWADVDGLFLGMANPMNLHERGGWELIHVKNRWLRPERVIPMDNYVTYPLTPERFIPQLDSRWLPMQ